MDPARRAGPAHRPPSRPCRAPWAPAILALATWGQLACAGDVTIAGAPPGDVRPPERCDDRPDQPPPSSRPIDVTEPKSGAFIDGHLHLEAKADGVERYLVLSIASPDLAHAVAAPDALLGPANLAPVAGAAHARVRTTPAGEVFVDVVDATNPTAPATLAHLQVDGATAAPWAPTFSTSDQRLFFCVVPEGQKEPQLAAVNLLDPAQPGEPELLGSSMCNRYPNGGVAAHRATWMVWGDESDLNMYSVSPAGPKKIGEYLYAPDGIHAYGAVVGAASDGITAVFDPENDSEMFLLDVVNGPADGVAHAYFGIGGPKRLLAVVGGIAYLAAPEGVRAYDVSDVNHAELLSYQADIPFGPDLAHLLAASERHLAVVDGAGVIYLVPLDQSGPVAPLKIEEPPPPPAEQPPCGR